MSEPILRYGGPYIVGKAIGLEWVELEDKEIWDESLRPTREETYALDFRGSLSLGSALEDRLSVAEQLDLQLLKKDLEKNKSKDIYRANTMQPNQYNIEGTINKKKLNLFPITVERNGERFNLNSVQRIHLLSTCLLFSLGSGHASQEVISNQLLGTGSEGIVLIAKIVSSVLVVVSIASSVASLPLCKQKNRGYLIWGLKGLLGGPDVVVQLSKSEAI